MFNADDGRQYRAFDLQSSGDRLEGYAVVFDQKTLIVSDTCQDKAFYETIDKNAFAGCDMKDVVLNVDHEGTPIARTRAGNLQLTVDDYGLKVSASLTTSRGKEIWEEVKAGNLDKMSFAFTVGQEHYDEMTRTRHIQKISRLYDVSVVTHPAYEQTCVFARASMEKYVEAERRACVEQRISAMRSMELKPAPELREEISFAGMEIDIARHEALLQRARELMAWTPEGGPKDVEIVEQRHNDMLSVVQEINQLAQEERRKITQVEAREVQFYGWGPLQIAPNSKEQIDALKKRGIKLKKLGMSKELWNYYLDQKDTEKRSLEKMSENIEIRALQSYICKGISNMDEDERRALTTTGSGAAVIPVEIADKIITNAGHSILTHRANRFADGRRGKLVIPMMLPNGDAGWHNELELIEEHDQNLSGVIIEGMELAKIVTASTAMNTMAVEEFQVYLLELLAGELLDTLEQAYITGKKGENGPADGLDNLDLVERTIPATGAITLENIAAAVAKLPSKVQYGAIVMGNASTLASLLTTQGNYAFDMRTTLKDMGIELVQNPYVSDGVVYVVGKPAEALFLNFWQPISVAVSYDALFVRAGIAIRALAVTGFAWVPEFVAKVAMSE